MNNLTLDFSSIIDDKSVQVRIKRVYFQTSWQADNVTLYKWSDHDPLDLYDDDPFINEYSCKLNLSGIPEGEQTVTVVVSGVGSYVAVSYTHLTLPTNREV